MEYHGFTVGEGNRQELSLAVAVATIIARHFNTDQGEFFIAGHTHEGLIKNAASVSWEGRVEDWPTIWRQNPVAVDLCERTGIYFEPINNCTLAVYPEGVRPPSAARW